MRQCERVVFLSAYDERRAFSKYFTNARFFMHPQALSFYPGLVGDFAVRYN